MKRVNIITINISKYLRKENIKANIFWFVFTMSIVYTFDYINVTYPGRAPGIFVNNIVLRSKLEVESNVFLDEYIYYVAHIKPKDPTSLIYHCIPFFETLNKEDAEYLEDIKGYFKMSAEEETFDRRLKEEYIPTLPDIKTIDLSKENFRDPYFMLRYFITGDANLSIDAELLKKWDFATYLDKEWRINDEISGPKVLIIHTHIKETYKDEEDIEKGVYGVGEKLKELLEDKYNIEVMHLNKSFYNEKGIQDKLEYDRADEVIPDILEENPSIQMIIDIHRDGVEGAKLVTKVNGKNTARIMFVQGICEVINKEGKRIPTNLKNEYIEDNLSFALQMQVEAYKYYPGLARKIYLKPYRYSTHMKPMSLIVEVGAQSNTFEEAINATYPLADIIAKVIEKD